MMIHQFLGANVARALQTLDAAAGQLTEIRLRTGRPLLARVAGTEHLITHSESNINERRHSTKKALFCPTAADLSETMERVSRHSYYAFETELAQGYITLPGGHRVGVAGQAVIENGAVRAWRHIGAMTIRVAHSVPGCADEVLPIIYRGGRFRHTMIISPPGFGKTTLLRDIVRQISDTGLTVGLVDERSEVAGCFAGVPQNDVGLRTDVLDGIPKAEGMTMLLRAMAPDVIAVDELGGESDARAVEAVINAGVKLLCTAHGYGMEDVQTNPSMARLFTRNIFERFITLDAPGRVQGIYKKDGTLCHAVNYERDGKPCSSN